MYKLSALFAATLLVLLPSHGWAATLVVPLQMPTVATERTRVVPLASSIPLDTSGNDLLRHLPTLFVLDTLFQNASNGLLTPGPATLQNLLILYRLFFTPTTHAQP